MILDANIEAANKALAEAYQAAVPDYSLEPVLEMLVAVEPKQFVQTAAECISMVADQIINGDRGKNKRTENILFTLKMILRTFADISYDEEEFYDAWEKEFDKSKRLANEPIKNYYKPI